MYIGPNNAVAKFIAASKTPNATVDKNLLDVGCSKEGQKLRNNKNGIMRKTINQRSGDAEMKLGSRRDR